MTSLALQNLTEQDYASEEDSDFTPESAPIEVSVSEDEVDDSERANVPKKRRRQASDGEAEDAGFENSGDEAIIEKGKRRRKKLRAKEDEDAGDYDGGEGCLIKTRSMRAQQKADRRTAVVNGPVTVDVDALWARMINEPFGPNIPKRDKSPQVKVAATTSEDVPSSQTSWPETSRRTEEAPAMVRIKRAYNFAGKIHTEEKLVPGDSAEAKVYLASVGDEAGAKFRAVGSEVSSKRMPRKAFRSAFEPIIDHIPQRTDLNLGISGSLQQRRLANEANANKLNTVEKSRMDWAGFVDKAGIKDELESAGKSKDSYTARQEFLARSEAKRGEDARQIRLVGKI